MKGCELCPGTARLFCESDQASLCFDCDGMVHGANFLVARHSRVLLCRSCQAPTPWKAAGPRLGPTVSVCDLCVSAGGRSMKKNDDVEDEGESAAREGVDQEDDANDGDHDDSREEEDVDDEEVEEDDEEVENGDDDDVDDDDEEEEEEGEEQVVPWSTEPLPPVASSSSSEEESTVGQRSNENNNNNNNGFLKRNRWGNVDLPSSSCNQDQLPCSSSSRPSYLPNPNPNRTVQTMADDDEATSDSFRPSKDRKKSDLARSGSYQLSAISFGSGRPPI